MSDEQGYTRERQYADPKRGQRKTHTGVVLANKMAKTITVSIERTEMHRKYKKYVRQHSKVYAHDENEQAKVGDVVQVTECRPMSKLKRFRLAGIVKAHNPGS